MPRKTKPAAEAQTALPSIPEELINQFVKGPMTAEAVHAASADLNATSDLHASAAYRRRVATALCLRALEQARANAAAKPAQGAR